MECYNNMSTMCMIHHTIAAAIQLDISPLTQRVDPATLTEPARTITQALLRDTSDFDPSWMHDPLAYSFFFNLFFSFFLFFFILFEPALWHSGIADGLRA